VALVGRLGGSATKGLPDDHGIEVLVDLPANRESEFRGAIASISGAAPEGAPRSSVSSTEQAPAPPPTAEKKSFVVQITETPAK
jgi:hypothetical protein